MAFLWNPHCSLRVLTPSTLAAALPWIFERFWNKVFLEKNLVSRAQSLSLTSILVVVDVVAGGSTEKVVHDGSKVSLASSFSDLSPQPLGSTTYLPNRPR
ncbi:hypothetical protein V6N13_063787 [Hibiscus sabdariffa]